MTTNCMVKMGEIGTLTFIGRPGKMGKGVHPSSISSFDTFTWRC